MAPNWDLLLGALLDAAPDGVLVCDSKGKLALVNLAAEAMFGYGHGELLGKEIETLIPIRSRPVHAQLVADYVASPRTRALTGAFNLQALRKDGSEFPVEISLSPLTTPDGMLIIAIVRDITERRQLERGHDRATTFLLSAVEAVPEAFLVYDEHDRVLMANKAAGQLFGAALGSGAGPPTSESRGEALVGMMFSELVARCLAAGLFDLTSEPAESLASRWQAYHRAPSGALDVHTADGRYLRMTDRITAEHGAVSMIADITGDMQHAAELGASRQVAEAAAAAKSEFLSSMSHELRTPLNAILGFAQLLENDRKHPLDDRQQERLGYVLRGGEHLLHLVNDVLDLSRIEAGKIAIALDVVDVADVIGEVVHTLEPLAARAEIDISAAPESAQDLRVAADRTRLVQILMNFGSNAIKYGKSGGRVTVAAQALPDAVRIAVEDDGLGIPEHKCAKIFEPFERAGQETGAIEGTGIGLTICKRLAELMHASVGFTTQAGRGSKFWVDVPLDLSAGQGDASASPSPPAVSLAAQEGKYTIVYVEDNPSNVALMREVVRDLPHVQLSVAITATLGLELIRHHVPQLVILDLHLPDMSGFEVAKRLRESPDTRKIPLIALSASALPTDRALAEQVGFDHFIVKPIHVADLIRILETTLHRQP